MGDVSQLHAGLAGMGAVAFDLDGVLYDRGVQVPGAARAVTAMRSAGITGAIRDQHHVPEPEAHGR